MKYINDDLQPQIDSYLRQEMTDLERAGFERRMHENPELHEEVKRQDAYISAIRQERMMELKSGLQAVQISLWSATAMEFARIAAISGGIGLASLGGYYFFSQQNSELKKKTEIVTEPKVIQTEKQATTSLSIPKLSSGSSETSEVRSGIETQPAPASSFASKQKTSTALPVMPEREIEEPAFKSVQPATPQDINLPEDGISHKTAPESMQPEVVIKRDNREKFHYQFTDGKLVLYADFNEKLYEVLELNQHGQKQLYLSYDGKFYSLNPEVNEISPLSQVKDRNLLQILAIYQKKK